MDLEARVRDVNQSMRNCVDPNAARRSSLRVDIEFMACVPIDLLDPAVWQRVFRHSVVGEEQREA